MPRTAVAFSSPWAAWSLGHRWGSRLSVSRTGHSAWYGRSAQAPKGYGRAVGRASAPVREPHFRLFGIPIRVEPFFVIVIALFGIEGPGPALAGNSPWCVIVFVSVLVHENRARSRSTRSSASARDRAARLRRVHCRPAAGPRVLSKPKSVIVSISGTLAQLLLLGLPAWLLWNIDWYSREDPRLPVPRPRASAGRRSSTWCSS